MKLTRQMLEERGISMFISGDHILQFAEAVEWAEDVRMRVIESIADLWRGMPSAGMGTHYKDTGNYLQIIKLESLLAEFGKRWCSTPEGEPLFPAGIALDSGWLQKA